MPPPIDKATLLLCFMIALMAACSHAPAPPEPRVIRSQTVLPTHFRKTEARDSGRGRILIPKGVIRMSRITRPRAEMRDGPGTRYAIKSRLLPRGTEVMSFDQIGVWKKVFLPDSGVSGWVHHRTLGAATKDDKLIELKLENLPRVFLANQIQEGFEFGTMKKVKIRIPKGAVFHTLNRTRDKILVLLNSTGSVMWIPGKDSE